MTVAREFRPDLLHPHCFRRRGVVVETIEHDRGIQTMPREAIEERMRVRHRPWQRRNDVNGDEVEASLFHLADLRRNDIGVGGFGPAKRRLRRVRRHTCYVVPPPHGIPLIPRKVMNADERALPAQLSPNLREAKRTVHPPAHRGIIPLARIAVEHVDEQLSDRGYPPSLRPVRDLPSYRVEVETPIDPAAQLRAVLTCGFASHQVEKDGPHLLKAAKLLGCFQRLFEGGFVEWTAVPLNGLDVGRRAA